MSILIMVLSVFQVAEDRTVEGDFPALCVAALCWRHVWDSERCVSLVPVARSQGLAALWLG